jgi:hypothetical protein
MSQNKITKTYDAILVKQNDGGSDLIMFSAPANEITTWAGVPSKKIVSDNETSGFQRVHNDKRVNALAKFYSEPKNTIQNPLLCASNNFEWAKVEFKKKRNSTSIGTVNIIFEDFEKMPLLETLKYLQKSLELRNEQIANRDIPEERITYVKNHFSAETGENTSDDNLHEEDFEEFENSTPSDALYSEETAIFDFHEEISARIKVLEELEENDRPSDKIAGFDKGSLTAYIKPTVLVDGQHRLLGAIKAMEELCQTPQAKEEVEEKINNGQDPANVTHHIESKFSRNIPISLLFNPDPEEHVFQFVVVNEKATPIPKPLLGTIVSTTLFSEENDNVKDRLEQCGIDVQDSRHVAFFIGNENSPFHRKVDRGLSQPGNLLQHNVMKTLVSSFRKLEGLKSYEKKPVDWAKSWRSKYLEDSGIVSNFEEKGFNSAYEYWQSDEIWRNFFIKFWAFVKERFASSDDSSCAYWGSPKSSNLFCKPSLNIIATDFFCYLKGRGTKLDSLEKINDYCNEWLDDFPEGKRYFERDWNLSGQKKDGTGLNRQWWDLFNKQRSNGGDLKKVSEFCKPMAV